MSVEITGTHPYADEFPLASEDELDELTASIATVGLIHPIIVDPAGLIVDGRNRLEACNRAQVEARTEVYEGTDDELKEFVIGVNTTGRRESMTVQIAAASAALIWGASKRDRGRWVGWSKGEVAKNFATSAGRKAKEQTGVVLDELGRDALREVRDGNTSLNAAYEYALAKRDEKRRALEDEARAETEEAEARAYIEANAPELLDHHPTAREARAVYLERNRAEKARIEREQHDHAEAIQRDANRVKAFLSGFDGAYSMRDHPHRDEVLNHLSATERRRFTEIEGAMTWPTSRI